MQKKWMKLITPIIIIAVILLAALLINGNKQETSTEIAKCIGKNSELYIQLGCHACKTQEEMFGESYQYLNSIDCFYEREKCIEKNITATPTWIISGKEYIGVQEIKELQRLTNC
jgi:hypothetical protein